LKLDVQKSIGRKAKRAIKKSRQEEIFIDETFNMLFKSDIRVIWIPTLKLMLLI
jgi:hypothetical protein